MPSVRRAKKSGACRRGCPDSVVQDSHIGWDATATTSGSEPASCDQGRGRSAQPTVGEPASQDRPRAGVATGHLRPTPWAWATGRTVANVRTGFGGCAPRQHLRFVRVVFSFRSALDLATPTLDGPMGADRMIDSGGSASSVRTAIRRGAAARIRTGPGRLPAVRRELPRLRWWRYHRERGRVTSPPLSLNEVHHRHRAAIELARITAGRDRNRRRVESGTYRAPALTQRRPPRGRARRSDRRYRAGPPPSPFPVSVPGPRRGRRSEFADRPSSSGRPTSTPLHRPATPDLALDTIGFAFAVRGCGDQGVDEPGARARLR